MKKLFTVLLIVGVLLTLSISAVSANGGPHGGYTPTDDACAGCHRAHTATSANLLINADTTTLCLTCHGTAGTGADTNVDDGKFLSGRSPSTEGTANTLDNANLNGGGFVNQNLLGVTSTHLADGTISNAWGYGVAPGAVGAMFGGESLDCASCHDPHGSTNYRIIPTVVNNVATTVTQVDEGAAKDYDDEAWAADVSNLCVACHDGYHDNASVTTHEVDMPYNYGGNVNPETVGLGGFFLPLAGADLVTCQTCHFPHGSSSVQSILAEGATQSGDGNPAGTEDSSALLRLDNRGVCEVCHQK